MLRCRLRQTLGSNVIATVFLVEDNKPDVELFRMALEEARVQCSLRVFQDGSEIIDHIGKSDPEAPGYLPDLLVLDLNLPKIDGLEILQLIRDTPGFADVPIAILSSSSSRNERTRLAAFSIREFIAKPADLDEYLSIGRTVGNLLEQRQLQHDSSARERQPE